MTMDGDGEWIAAAQRMLDTAHDGETLDAFLLRAVLHEPDLEESAMDAWAHIVGSED